MRIGLLPAYGRDYKSKREIMSALADGRDFQISDTFNPHHGRYINLDQILPEYHDLTVRHGALRKVAVIDLKDLTCCALLACLRGAAKHGTQAMSVPELLVSLKSRFNFESDEKQVTFALGRLIKSKEVVVNNELYEAIL